MLDQKILSHILFSRFKIEGAIEDISRRPFFAAFYHFLPFLNDAADSL